MQMILAFIQNQEQRPERSATGSTPFWRKDWRCLSTELCPRTGVRRGRTKCRYPQACRLWAVRPWFYTDLQERGERQVPTGGKERKLGQPETQAQASYQKDNALQLWRTDQKTQRGVQGLAEQLPIGKRSGKAQETWWVAKKPYPVLHLAWLEGRIREYEEPDCGELLSANVKILSGLE